MRKRTKVYIFLLVSLIIFADGSFPQSIEEIFKEGSKLIYKVYYNGVPVGKLEWVYLGKEHIGEKEVDALYTDADADILQFLNLISKERIFLDVKTHLPVKVERDLIYFGKKEIIEEFYNQSEGYVKVVKRNSQVHEKIIYQDKPIHNILSLIYFFPKEVALEKGDRLTFNLPMQKIKIKVKAFKELTFDEEKRETFFLVGSGAKKFNLWLDKKERIPLRIEFFLPIGKVTIKRDK